MKHLFIIFFLLNTQIAGAILKQLPEDDYKSWVQLEKNNIQVYYSKDLNVPWCRATANFRFSQDDIYSALKNLKNYKNIFDRVTDSKLFDENIVYIRLDMPYIFADRDYTVKYLESTKDEEIIFQFYSVFHANTPNNRGSVTLPRAAGEWRLIPIGNNATRVVYTWNGELLGKFPNSSLKTAWAKQGTEVMTWLNEYLKSIKED